MPKTRKQKQDTVAKLADKLSRAKSVVLADYKGMTMAHLTDLRTQLKDQEAEMIVTKNNLLKLAFKDNNFTQIDEKLFEGPIAILFAFYDEITPIKTLAKTIKSIQIGSIKAGFINGEYLEPDKVNNLALVPSRDELRAKVVGSLGSPIYGIVGVLQANLRNLVYTLEQIRLLKGGV